MRQMRQDIAYKELKLVEHLSSVDTKVLRQDIAYKELKPNGPPGCPCRHLMGQDIAYKELKHWVSMYDSSVASCQDIAYKELKLFTVLVMRTIITTEPRHCL